MNKCPICERYMNSHMEPTHDGSRIVWECPCGYTNKNNSFVMDNKTNIINKKRNTKTKGFKSL